MNRVRKGLALLGFVVLLGAAQHSAGAQTRWYNGDFDGATGLLNGSSNASRMARTFENFTVTDAGGWQVNELWSNDLSTSTVGSTADWSIRTGMSIENGGTVVASGISNAIATLTGNSLFGVFREYKIDVSGLSLYLAPGNYWLSVSPTMMLGDAYNSTTSGANGVGSPVADHNSLFNWPDGGYNYVQTSYTGHGDNFSMGVGGTIGANAVTPEGSSLAMMALGLLPLAYGFRRKLHKA